LSTPSGPSTNPGGTPHAESQPAPSSRPRFPPRLIPVALYLVGVIVFASVAGKRLFHQSSDPHYIYQADAWLHGELAIRQPLKGDDWAKVETVVLDDGSEVRGRRLTSRPMFKVAGGDEIPIARVRQRNKAVTAYVSFPPFPAVVLLPQAAIWGRNANDVLPTVLIAALVLPLMFLVLRRLGEAGLATRSLADQLWLVATLAFGTVFFFVAVQGKVWFTAHVIGVVLALLYAWASIEAKHPVVAGLALALAATTRPPMAFMVPLFVLEAWRMAGGLARWRSERPAVIRALVRTGVRFAAPVIAIAAVAMVLNQIRFGSPTEFGHSYLDVRQQAQIEQYGLFSYHYLARNLAVAFTLLPELPGGKAAWFQISGHGLAMWVTTPILLALLWPATRSPIHRALWITVAFVAIPILFYQNSGWYQFGYRFSLDYMPFLIVLLAVGGRRLGWISRGLIVLGIVINLFGAITFGQEMKYYRLAGDAYNVVVAH
jgi:hypothetical protein